MGPFESSLPKLIQSLLGWFLLEAKEYFFVGATATSGLLAISNSAFGACRIILRPRRSLRPLLMTGRWGSKNSSACYSRR
jgi:hypothetical protein